MAVITPDYSQETKPIDKGTYDARIKKFEMKKSQNTGDRYIMWTLEVTNGDHAGKTLSHNTMIEGRGAGLLKKFLKTIDQYYEDGPFDPEGYLGMRCGIEVGPEEYQGKTSMKIKEVLPLEQKEEESF